jgi:hypothetical protein
MHGQFCWYELMTPDTASAAAFYGAVLGWGTQPGPVLDEHDYQLFTAAGRPVAGLMPLPEDCVKANVPPMWVGYVAVDDVDAAAALAVSLGAVSRVEPQDIPGVGRFAVLSDPQGATIALFKPLAGTEGAGPSPAMAWHELRAAAWPAAFAFYARLFGWAKDQAMDMGEMGTYQIFAAGGQAIGGMFDKQAAMPRAHWLYYAAVPDVDAALAAAQAAGATILHGPHQVPGGGWIVQAMDPQGAAFAVHGPRKA